MIKKLITYTDFNGAQQTDELYFNLSKAELTELQVSVNDGLDKQLKEIVTNGNAAEIIKMLKTIIAKSYGIRSEDGKRFIKREELSRDFLDSAAYDELFIQLASDPNAAMEFIKGILPADIAREVEKAQAQENKPVNAQN